MNKYLKNMKQNIKSVSIPKRFKLSGPQKISIKNRSSFSLPAGSNFSCPGETKACNGCYAKKKRHTWPIVQKVMANNWKLLNKFEKNNQMTKCVNAIIKEMRPELKIFRIHESGDLYSEWYINMWAKVVKLKKDVSFWTYTRSFHLNFTKLTRNKNFTLWASTDQYNEKEAKKFVRRFKKSGVKHAYGPWDHKAPKPKNSFICGVTNGKLAMVGACEKCKLCVIKNRTNKNVIFLKH